MDRHQLCFCVSCEEWIINDKRQNEKHRTNCIHSLAHTQNWIQKNINTTKKPSNRVHFYLFTRFSLFGFFFRCFFLIFLQKTKVFFVRFQANEWYVGASTVIHSQSKCNHVERVARIKWRNMRDLYICRVQHDDNGLC